MLDESGCAVQFLGYEMPDEQFEEERRNKPLEPGGRGDRVEAERNCAQVESCGDGALEINRGGEHSSGGEEQGKTEEREEPPVAVSKKPGDGKNVDEVGEDEPEVLEHADALAVIPPLRGLGSVGNRATDQVEPEKSSRNKEKGRSMVMGEKKHSRAASQQRAQNDKGVLGGRGLWSDKAIPQARQPWPQGGEVEVLRHVGTLEDEGQGVNLQAATRQGWQFPFCELRQVGSI